jgi:DNA-binding response OmpR family regulator
MPETGSQKTRILALDDDENTLFLIAECLCPEHQVVAVRRAREALQACRRQHFHLALVDVRLPETSGFDLVPRLRRIDPHMGIILITAHARIADAVKAARDLEVADYIPKPFDIHDLMGKVRDALERSSSERWLRWGDLTIDRKLAQVEQAGRKLSLTSQAFRLLLALVQRQGKVARYEDLWREVWDYEPCAAEPEPVQIAISRLRRKLGQAPGAPQYIETIRGMGYRAVWHDFLPKESEERKGRGQN